MKFYRKQKLTSRINMSADYWAVQQKCLYGSNSLDLLCKG